MENEKNVKNTKVEVQKEKNDVEVIDSGYYGITIRKDENFVKRSDLTKKEIKGFSRVLVQLTSKFTNKSNSQRDSINIRIYPFSDKKDKEVIQYDFGKCQKFSDFIRLNDDNKVRLVRTEFIDVLLSMNMVPEVSDMNLELVRYGRFLTSIGHDGKRNYRVQVFLSFDCVKAVFIRENTLSTISTLVKKGYIEPVEFIEASAEEFDLEEEELI